MTNSVMNRFNILSLLLGLIFSISSAHASITSAIPDDLKQWVPWVIKDQPTITCPITYNQNLNVCAYPGSLSIKMIKNSARFSQSWDVMAQSWVSLPGDNKNWPQNVKVNQKTYPVINHQGMPSIQLEKGVYTISGELSWIQAPKSITIPRETGLVELQVDNKKINMPDFRQGKLWLKTVTAAVHKNNHLDVQVFRKITDKIPLQLTTQIKLDVSGQQREVILTGALLENFEPMSINSRLPSQLDKQGRLKIQIRPGQWTIDINSYNAHSLTSIVLPKFKSPSNSTPESSPKSTQRSTWPENEIWVLDAQPHLRLIKVIDKNSIDPNQTRLPAAWKSLPAFAMKSGEVLSFDVIKRGNPEPEPDQLTLTKKIWLDFDGNGFTVNDKIAGKLSSTWRLNVSDEFTLGQVTLNGKPQFITQDDNKHQGVEVRHGNLDLSADSRIENATRTFKAAGWDMDFNKVSATLYLPAGWQLLSLTGATTHAWIDRWTLLDLFMVLITAIVIYKIWGLPWGLLSLVTLVLVWHESMSPQYIWINLAVAVVLIRSLPAGKFLAFVQGYRLLTTVALVLILLSFLVTQARTALYPQLEFGNRLASQVTSRMETQQAYTQNDQTVSPQSMAQAPRKMVGRAYEELSLSSYMESDALEDRSLVNKKIMSIDPDAMIQTGPGLPSWKLHQYRLYWDGPVRSDQTLSMTLLSPTMHSLLNILRIMLVLLLAWRLLDIKSFKPPYISGGSISKGIKNSAVSATAPALVGLILFGGVLSGSPFNVQAAFPDKTLLDELKKEITKPAECLPQCASIENMTIDLSADQLNISLKVHAQQSVLMPLPVPIKQWSPSRLMVNGKTASALIRRNDDTLWLQTEKGTHSVKITGRVDYLNQLQFVFPLKPHHITTQIKNWTVEGLDKETSKITALSFLRIVGEGKTLNITELQQTEIAVYAEVSRSIELGLDWHVSTVVKGLSGSAYPLILSVPLIEGESVITDNIKVKDNQAIVTLSNRNQKIRFTSKLASKNSIKLLASEQKQFIEKWSLVSSPIWHIQYDGIPVIYHQRQGGNWQPEWQPWPGETVTINVSRPQGIKGKTVTIDSSTLTLEPGEQITAAKLNFNLRSSLGGQHTIQLPENIKLQSVSINNQNMPIRETEQGLTLPISPGNQKIEISWREARGISSIFSSSLIDLGSESVNNVISIKPGSNRWVLFASGPTMGPAVLFWGMFIVIVIIAAGLGQVKATPLNTLQWILLGIGLSASQPWAVVIIAGCIFALRYRGTFNTQNLSRLKFNAYQVLLVLLIFLSISSLLAAIEQGLLGSPDMQITGNGSSTYELNWYTDRIDSILPGASMFSVPVYIYQLMMLAWSIWLAFALIKWAQWGWGNFSKQEYWRSKEPKFKHKKVDATANNDNDDSDDGWTK
ncbi:MAG: hypothetical protein OQK98_11550 [Gammaproteobacteria bacterium]|nr:hypothetical protein [Gammaproteobacteria bacterium]